VGRCGLSAAGVGGVRGAGGGDRRLAGARPGAAAAARRLAEDHGFPDETWGVPAQEEVAVHAALAALERQGHLRACLKAPFGIAGRGLIQVRTGGLSGRDLTWLRPMLYQQQAVVVEPWLERVADFSCQYELTPGRLPRFKGQVRLYNDAGGRFLACGAAPSFTRLLPPEAARCLHARGAEKLYQETLPQLLTTLPGLSRLHGSLGIDAFLYRTASGEIRLRPLVEINPRTTMGRVTLDLRRWVDPSKNSRFRIAHRRAILAEGHASLAAYASQLQAQSPPQLAPTSSGPRLVSGCQQHKGLLHHLRGTGALQLLPQLLAAISPPRHPCSTLSRIAGTNAATRPT
jgi:hypothetical protein